MSESDIFLAASQIENPELRAAFLDSVCKGDVQLRQRLQDLLQKFASWELAVDRFSSALPQHVATIREEQPSELEQLQPDSPSSHTSTNKPKASLTLGQKFQHYEVQSCLGVGGMGEVYLAFDRRLNRKVALKILPPHRTRDIEWVRRFQGEAQAVSSLNHPNILTVFEIGQHDGLHFMATEYVDGQPLRSCIDQDSLSLAEKIRFGIDIAHALDAAHQADIVHRDLKPENVMVRRDGLVKVLDFGLAKQTVSSAESLQNAGSSSSPAVTTDPGMMLGTVRYMSPEQVRRIALDYRSDIFSFGVVLYELLTGNMPFPGSTDADVIAAILQKEPNPIPPNWIPDELQRLVMTMLRKDRGTRLVSAKEIAIELELILEQVPSTLHRKPLSTGAGIHRLSSAIECDPSEDDFAIPEVRYARSEQVNIAYQVLGSGEIDIVFVMGWVSHLDWFWKEPSFARFLRRLASFSRLILFDKRGTGLSDRVPSDMLPTLEQRMDDVRAVMNAVGSDRAVLCGVSEGGPMCSLFAATYPQKTTALVMIGCYARRLWAANYPWGPSPEQHLEFLEDIKQNWGGPVGIDVRAPSRANDRNFRSWWATYLRMGASPGAALALTKMNSQIDVRPILKTIQVPTLIVHRSGDKCLRVEEGKYLAENIPGAQFVELPGTDHLPFVGHQEEILEPIQQFLTGVTHSSHLKRVLATVLYARIVTPNDSTSCDSATVATAHAVREVELFRGRSFTSPNYLVIATFDGPARAVRAAMAIRASAHRLGVPIKIGLVTGECEQSEQEVTGPAIDLARWVTDQAKVGEILVSGTLKDLVAGADLHFTSYAAGQSVLDNSSKLFSLN